MTPLKFVVVIGQRDVQRAGAFIGGGEAQKGIAGIQIVEARPKVDVAVHAADDGVVQLRAGEIRGAGLEIVAFRVAGKFAGVERQRDAVSTEGFDIVDAVELVAFDIQGQAENQLRALAFVKQVVDAGVEDRLGVVEQRRALVVKAEAAKEFRLLYGQKQGDLIRMCRVWNEFAADFAAGDIPHQQDVAFQHALPQRPAVQDTLRIGADELQFSGVGGTLDFHMHDRAFPDLEMQHAVPDFLDRNIDGVERDAGLGFGDADAFLDQADIGGVDFMADGRRGGRLQRGGRCRACAVDDDFA